MRLSLEDESSNLGLADRILLLVLSIMMSAVAPPRGLYVIEPHERRGFVKYALFMLNLVEKPHGDQGCHKAD